MTIAPDQASRAAAGQASMPRRLAELAPGMILVMACAAALASSRAQAAPVMGLSAVLYVLLAVMLLWRAPAHRASGGGFGSADLVTLARSTLALPLLALALLALAPGPALPTGDAAARWWVIAIGAVALALDGLDGAIARRTDTATEFGARFDMELDNLLLVALSLLVWRAEITGPWVLLIGALRYLFVAAAWLWPWLDGPLPPSFRRKAVCVVQGIALLVVLAPVIPSPAASLVAVVALGSLVYSFAVDVVALRRAHLDRGIV